MERKSSKILKGVVIAVLVLLVLSAAAVVFVYSKMGGDAEVMADIDRHFQAVEQALPLPAAGSVAVQSPSLTGGADPPVPPATAAPGSSGRPGRAGKQKNTPQAQSKEKDPDPSTEQKWPGIQNVAPGTYVIDRSLVDDAQGRPARYTGGVRADLVEQGGEAVGFRITGVSKTSALYAAGLRNGDVLTNVNGHRLTSADEAVLAVAALRFNDRFRLDLLRDGGRRCLYYRVAGE